MDYWDVAWSSIEKIERVKLDRAQRRAAKIVLKTTDSDAENLKWLPLSIRRHMHTINLTFKCLKDPLQCFLKIILRFLEQPKTRGKVGKTCCSKKSKLRRQGSIFILMDQNFLIIFLVKWRILSQLWFLKLVFWNYIDQKLFSYLLSFCQFSF